MSWPCLSKKLALSDSSSDAFDNIVNISDSLDNIYVTKTYQAAARSKMCEKNGDVGRDIIEQTRNSSVAC